MKKQILKNKKSVQPQYGTELTKIRNGESFQKFAIKCEVDKSTIMELEKKVRIPSLDTHNLIVTGMGKKGKDFDNMFRVV